MMSFVTTKDGFVLRSDTVFSIQVEDCDDSWQITSNGQRITYNPETHEVIVRNLKKPRNHG